MSETIFLQLTRLGDCVQSTVLISSWRARYPEDRIVVLSRPAFAAAYEGNPDVDELVLCEPPKDLPNISAADLESKTSPLFPLMESLKKRKFHAVINLTHDLFGRRLATQLQCETLRGFTMDAEDKMVANDPWSLYLLSFLKYRNLNLFNLVDIYAHFSGAAAVRDTPRFVVDDKCRSEIQQWLDEIQPGGSFVGFQPGASRPERRWPAENFIQLGKELAARHNANVLVFGAPNEDPLARYIADRIPNAKSFAGRTSIPQLAALLEKCKALVTNDTGTMHVAAAVGTRIIALFESSAFFRETGPYGSGHWIIQSRQLLEYGDRTADELRRMQRIPVENVWTAVDTILSEGEGMPASNLPDHGADHYRSVWANGIIDYPPAVPVLMKQEDMCARLQRPIWLALLNGREVNPDQAVEEAFSVLKNHYAEPPAPSVPEMLEQFQKDAQKTHSLLLRLRDLVDFSLQKLRKNPSFHFSEDQLSKLTAGENAVLQSGTSIAVQPFVGYFEIALATVRGRNTREFLQNYRRHVIFLDKQLKALQAVLQSAHAKWK